MHSLKPCNLGPFQFLEIPFRRLLIFFYILGEDSSDISIRDLPLEIIKDLVKILTNTLTLVGHCGPSQANNLTLGLHTRTDPATPISLNLTNPQEIQKGKKTILIAHGYLSNPNQASFQNMKNKYLTKYDCNLLLLDWSNITFQSYNSVYCQIPHVADRLADFFCLLEKSYGIALRDLHLVGHSLGAQLSGKIGQLTKAKCNRSVGRITGLDPAGPQFYGFSKSHRLDKDDADFVDVIHTNRGVFGYYGNCGDSDFYVNCGADQPGCLVVNVTEIMKTSLSVGKLSFWLISSRKYSLLF